MNDIEFEGRCATAAMFGFKRAVRNNNSGHSLLYDIFKVKDVKVAFGIFCMDGMNDAGSDDMNNYMKAIASLDRVTLNLLYLLDEKGSWRMFSGEHGELPFDGKHSASEFKYLNNVLFLSGFFNQSFGFSEAIEL